MKIEGYEETSGEEYDKLPEDEGIKCLNCYEDKYYYFKKAQKFPIVFEDKEMKIELEKEFIRITDKDDDEVVYFYYKENFPLLVKAVEKAKEVAKKNES